MVDQPSQILTNRSVEYGVVLAARGRGKSAALGRAIAAVKSQRNVGVTAGHGSAVTEVLRFANCQAPESEIVFRPIDDILKSTEHFDALVIDEAAQLPVATLQTIVERYDRIPLAFSTTNAGYEGTGRGFILRFLKWLSDRGQPVKTLRLNTPIRWAAQDPLEQCMNKCLMLNIEMSVDSPLQSETDTDALDRLEYQKLDRSQLLARPRLLASFFGLLVHAHYRTTPSDLQTLDGSNIELHALQIDRTAAAATMIAKEGG